MSADFEAGAEGGGLGDWVDGYELGPGTGLGAAFGVGAGSGHAPAFGRGGAEPAYSAYFGWAPPLIPLPRRAPDELF
ncbi:hypothetical protein [Saccharothrix variisporea]|uniref:Uncharacterized protein n=1 Tax=Saccharothrix variisporea TaxID=543527 RepID=A0A495XI94_9PSEU|nr:hypothetical protein [Saccharothrix variisporea]RKT72233.1 hypothetical protein DFJ66_5541 [Saccharothrix variisporea]